MKKESTQADICLILEGTYPYVTGGVSSWTHRLITRLPEFRFHLLCLVPDEKPRAWAYKMPENVVGQTDVALSVLPSEVPTTPFQPQSTPRTLFSEIETFHHELLKGDTSGFPELYRQFEQSPDHKKLFHDLLTSRESWEILRKLYADQFHEESFIDFFWMWRTTHIPLFRVLSVPIPAAGVYHALSTGYAGMLGVMGHLSRQRPLLITEHGIYTRERRIEIALAEWIGGKTPEGGTIRPVNETVRGFWMRIFEQIGRIVYRHADPIVTLFEGNRTIEIREGADPEKIRIIPNGIDLSGMLPKQSRSPEEPRIVALVGRVVPIKDVKTFVQAARIVRDQESSVKFLILGPTDHDPDYYEECLELVRSLSLEPHLSFTGSVDLSRYYPRIDILVLTSLSEAQPLVIMEAGASGIPVVASRVGACEELLTGRTPPDRALGPSGLLTGIGSPHETALSILRLLRDPELSQRMGMTGRRRMDLFYKESDVFDAYRTLYKEKMAGWPE